MSFVSMKPLARLGAAGGWRRGHGASLPPPQQPLCPQACNCDQYLKVSKNLMRQLMWPSDHQEGPSSIGECTPQGWAWAPCGLWTQLLGTPGRTYSNSQGEMERWGPQWCPGAGHQEAQALRTPLGWCLSPSSPVDPAQLLATLPQTRRAHAARHTDTHMHRPVHKSTPVLSRTPCITGLAKLSEGR